MNCCARVCGEVGPGLDWSWFSFALGVADRFCFGHFVGEHCGERVDSFGINVDFFVEGLEARRIRFGALFYLNSCARQRQGGSEVNRRHAEKLNSRHSAFSGNKFTNYLGVKVIRAECSWVCGHLGVE